MSDRLPIFDGHNDVLLRLFNKKNASAHEHFLNGDGEGHIDMPRARAGGFAGGMFAVYISSRDDIGDVEEMMKGSSYDVPLPRMISSAEALPVPHRAGIRGPREGLPLGEGNPRLPQARRSGGGTPYRRRRSHR
jgi:hypothetical protein